MELWVWVIVSVVGEGGENGEGLVYEEDTET